METSSELSTALCTHCEKEIPASNFELHRVHCHQNLQKCTICGDMVPKKHADKHYSDTHAPICCSQCGETVPRDLWSVHKSGKCIHRAVTCEYCDFPTLAFDLFEHQDICGNRTEYCHTCNKYVRLRERIDHEIQFHYNSDGTTAESSSGSRASESEEDGHRAPAVNASESEEDGHRAPAVNASESEEDGHRAPAVNASESKILLSIAAAGIAIVLGFFFLERSSTRRKQ